VITGLKTLWLGEKEFCIFKETQASVECILLCEWLRYIILVGKKYCKQKREKNC